MSISFMISWTVAYHAPLSVEFSRQECWSGLPFPPPGDLPNTEIEPLSPVLPFGFFTTAPPENSTPIEIKTNKKTWLNKLSKTLPDSQANFPALSFTFHTNDLPLISIKCRDSWRQRFVPTILSLHHQPPEKWNIQTIDTRAIFA